MKRKLTFLCCILAVVVFSAPQTMAVQPKYGGILVVGTQQDPVTLNPATTLYLHSHIVADAMFNTLVRPDPENPKDVKPDLATSWEVSEDGTVYTFHLAKNVKWHDGMPFTSDDVKFTFETVISEYHPFGGIAFGSIDKIEIPDKYTVVFKLKHRDFDFFTWLQDKRIAPIIPKHLYEGTDIFKNPFNFKPVGTGPFKFKKYVKANYIHVVRNENYFKEGLPYLDEIIFKIIPSMPSMLVALEAGEVDYIAWNIPRREVIRLQETPGIGVDLKLVPNATALWTRFNLRHPVLKNKKVRQAVVYATDKKEILDKVLLGQGYVGHTGVNPHNPSVGWAYNPDAEKYEYNPQKANALLDEAGFPRKSNGFRFKIRQMTSASDLEAGKTNKILKEQWRKVGIDLQLFPVEGTVYPQYAYYNWDFDLAMGFWSFGPTPQISAIHFHSKQIRKGLAPSNIMDYRNKVVDECFDKAPSLESREKRAELYHKIQTEMAEDVPAIWFIDPEFPFVYRETFAGLPIYPYGYSGEYDYVWWKKGQIRK